MHLTFYVTTALQIMLFPQYTYPKQETKIIQVKYNGLCSLNQMD